MVMAEYVIRILGHAPGHECRGCGIEGTWVQSCDVDAHGPGKPYPTGWLETTSDVKKARRFATAAEAILYYRRVSTAHPVRPDGKPNKPLTAFSVCVEPLREEGADEW